MQEDIDVSGHLCVLCELDKQGVVRFVGVIGGGGERGAMRSGKDDEREFYGNESSQYSGQGKGLNKRSGLAVLIAMPRLWTPQAAVSSPLTSNR